MLHGEFHRVSQVDGKRPTSHDEGTSFCCTLFVMFIALFLKDVCIDQRLKTGVLGGETRSLIEPLSTYRLVVTITFPERSANNSPVITGMRLP